MQGADLQAARDFSPRPALVWPGLACAFAEPESRAPSPIAAAARDSHHQQRARRVLGYLHTSLTNGVTLTIAARVACMSPGAFSRWYHQHFGITFQEHLVALRVAKACELLAAGNDKITHVAAASGFRNLSNFNRLFLRQTGRRPSQYRTEARRARLQTGAART